MAYLENAKILALISCAGVRVIQPLAYWGRSLTGGFAVRYKNGGASAILTRTSAALMTAEEVECCRFLERSSSPDRSGQLAGAAVEIVSDLASDLACSSFLLMSTLQEIEAAILRLPESDRLHLADTLLGSLPLPPAAHEPDEIIAEALRRDAELESGRVQPLSEEQFWAGVRRPRG
ncbi:MAG: putative addiction module component [Verrucomicrobiota bacterium]